MAQAEENGQPSTRSPGANDEQQDDDYENRQRSRNAEVAKSQSDDGREEAKGVVSASKLKKVQPADPKPPPQQSQQDILRKRN